MPTPGQNDFDFFIGRWRVAHSRLVERLAESDAWQEFDGLCTTQKILAGQGNIDDNVINLPAGAYRAATLRTFDPKAKQWSIWWLDARRPRRLDTPLVGAFEKGVGTFFADELINERPIRIRFLWTRTHTPSPRWEQAFSSDGGSAWETNWTMDFTRLD